MPIRSKASGTYLDVEDVFIKTSGVYTVCPGVHGKITGVYERIDNALSPSMFLGTNVAWPSTFQGAWMFNNLALTMDVWARVSGSGSFTQDQGALTPTVGTDEFRAYLSDEGLGLPTGTYTVYNPDGCNIAIGDFSDPIAFHAYTTATQFTFTYSGGSFLGLWNKGGVTRTLGNIAVVMPGQTANHLAGNKWNTEFMSFIDGLSPTVIRTLDWNQASNNYEVDWSDRVQPGRISYSKNGGTFIPWEDMCDFANRAAVDIWICIPTRSNDDYITNLTSILEANLDAAREVWVEHSNEVWNTSTPWKDGLKWIEYLDHTRYTAVATPATDTFTLAAHGLVEDEPLICFTTLENKVAAVSVNTQLRYGGTCYAKVVDANNFQAKATAGGSVIDVVTGQVNVTYIKANESGKTADRDTHYAELSIRDWDILDAGLGADRIKHICASQSASTTMTANRLGAGLLARTDYTAVAPYMYGSWFGGRVTPATTVLKPAFWGNSNHGPYTVHVGLYDDGTNPTIQNVLDGDGTGFIAKQEISFTSGSAYLDGTNFTGLTDDVTYNVVFVVISQTDREWKFSVDAVPSATPTTVYAYDSYANQAIRNRLDTINTGMVQVPRHYTQSGSTIPVVCYEGGLHFSDTAPTQMGTWLEAYLESTEFRDCLKHYLYSMASVGAEVFCFYSDCLNTFSLADSYADVADLRYAMYASLNGSVRQKEQPTVSDQAPPFLTEPGAYPATVHTMPDATLTYRILNGDNNGIYQFNGANLEITATTGVNWSGSTTHSLMCEADNGFVSKLFTISFYIGTETWYEPDAAFAWSSVDDADNAELNPALGAVCAMTGVGATIAAGLWDLNADTTYQETNALTGTLALTAPCLFAAVLERDDHTATNKNLVQFGSGSTFTRFMRDVGAFNARFFSNEASPTIDINVSFGTDIPATKSVCWFFYDADNTAPTWHAGVNQNVINTNQIGCNDRTFGRFFRIGGAANDSDALHGSCQAVRRTGLTLAQAKAIVQKMQDHHGI